TSFFGLISFACLVSHLFALCFFSSSPSSLDLLSFPTRRSSDLLYCAAGRPPAVSPADGRSGPAVDPFSSRQGLPGPQRGPARERSEEHTSELQSPDHLVCRLLLEKKKSKQQRIASSFIPMRRLA